MMMLIAIINIMSIARRLVILLSIAMETAIILSKVINSPEPSTLES